MSHPAEHAAPHTSGRVIHAARAYHLLTSLLGAGPRSAARARTIRNADLQIGENVLDVGCGSGVLTILASERVGSTGAVHGIDPSPGMVSLAQEKAKKSGSKAEFRLAVVEDLPFPDASFDVVLSSLMIHHLPEDVRRKGFQEIKRVLRPGGRFLVFDLSGKGSLVWRILSIVGHRLPSDYAQQLSEMVGAAGFAPQIIPSQKQYVTVVGHKPA